LRELENTRARANRDGDILEIVLCPIETDLKRFNNLIEKSLLPHAVWDASDMLGALCTSWRIKDIPGLLVYHKSLGVFHRIKVQDISQLVQIEQLTLTLETDNDHPVLEPATPILRRKTLTND